MRAIHRQWSISDCFMNPGKAASPRTKPRRSGFIALACCTRKGRASPMMSPRPRGFTAGAPISATPMRCSISACSMQREEGSPKTMRRLSDSIATRPIPAMPARCSGLGWLYETGNGVAEDEKQGVVYYRKAAEVGHTDSMTNLASMLIGGRGTQVDVDEAATWIYRALAGGN